MPHYFFNELQKSQILAAINRAEHKTSGEIRVHLELNCDGDVLNRASEVFEKLKMHKTSLRNGVLIYMAIDDRKFAIIGDAGINKNVNQDYWNKLCDETTEMFKNKQFSEGICHSIFSIGQILKEFYPYQSDDINELSDEISFG